MAVKAATADSDSTAGRMPPRSSQAMLYRDNHTPTMVQGTTSSNDQRKCCHYKYPTLPGDSNEKTVTPRK